MKASIKKRKKKFLALLLSVMMLTSATAALASCSDGGGSSTSSEDTEVEDTGATEKDKGLIKNASFETFDDNDGLNLIGTSVTGWTRTNNQTSTGSALTSKAASGIIDTAAWDDLTTTKLADEEAASKLTVAEAEELWEEGLTSRDKLLFYKAWKDADENEDKKIAEELEDFYQAFNIDEEDLPEFNMENPGTRFDNSLVSGSNFDPENTNILMIHNQYPATSASNPSYPNQGTAQKYTSTSTVTVKAGTAAQFSVWVKTANLTCADTNGNLQEAVGKGAYINVTHTVGGKTLDAVKIENINTKGVTENNGWVQYSFFLKGSSYTDTTFTVVLGLGQGGNTDKHGHVNGYAFFDDLQCDAVSLIDYDNAISELGAGSVSYKEWTNALTADAESKQIDVSTEENANTFHYALDFYGAFTDSDLLDSMQSADISATTEESNNKVYTSVAGSTSPITAPWLNGGFATSDSLGKDVTAVFSTAADMNDASNKYLQSVYNQHFANFDNNKYLQGNDILMLLSTQGAAYTAHDKDYASFTLSDNSYMAISFFVKTSDMKGLTGAGITLHDGNTQTSFSAIDTTDITTVDLGDNEDIYDGWQQCFFFVSNETGASKTFTLSFNYGPTSLIDKTTADFRTGFAAFTGFKTCSLTEKEFESAQSGTYAKVVSLAEAADESTTNSGFDSAASITLKTDKDGNPVLTTIEDGIVNLKNYIGVYSDSDYVKADGDGKNTAANLNENAGLLSREYFTDPEEGYFDTYYNDYANAPAWFISIIEAAGGTAAVDAEENKATFVWNKVFGEDSVQPLYILNENSEKSYGYIAKSTATLSASGYVAVSAKVKVSENAKAYVYLIGMEDDAPTDILSIDAKATYWYDDDGNICVVDPKDSDFNKKTDIAFKLQTSNGLYKVNTKWSGAKDLDANAYYANLSAYTQDHVTKDYLVAENGVSYNYTNNWLNDGNDGIAFYYENVNGVDKWFAESARKTEVLDLADVTALPHRTEAQEAKQLYQVVEGTNDEWVTVTFYLHAGDEAKNYRLEVWSGSRDGKDVNEAGSYVMFDINTPADVTTNFPLLIEAYKKLDGAEYFESVFSFYDTDKFLRYDESADENNVGNSYEDYLSSAYTEGVAYLKYTSVGTLGTSYETFADYSYSERTVAASTDSDDTTEDEEDDTTEDESNPWILISSIAVAAVLLLAMLSIVVRKLWKKSGKRSSKTVVSKPAKEKKAKKVKPAKQKQDEDSPYND